MAICECCGKEYDPNVACDLFDIAFSDLSYDHLKPSFCEDCAIEAMDEEEEGIYFETCEKCGRHFDLWQDDHYLEDVSVRDYWHEHGIICAACAEKIQQEQEDAYRAEHPEDFVDEYLMYDDDEDDEDGEMISLEDAADIYASSGLDEDYTFGYDPDELRKHL